jgi:hypothetical protein
LREELPGVIDLGVIDLGVIDLGVIDLGIGLNEICLRIYLKKVVQLFFDELKFLNIEE